MIERFRCMICEGLDNPCILEWHTSCVEAIPKYCPFEFNKKANWKVEQIEITIPREMI